MDAPKERPWRSLCASSVSLCGERVVSRRAVRLIYADWLPQDGVSAGSYRCLGSSIDPKVCS